MPDFIPWNSQPMADWTAKYAAGKIIELDGLSTHYIEKCTTEVMFYATRKPFFDTLTEEIKTLSLMNIPTLII